MRARLKKNFDAWMADVDRWLITYAGCAHEDLPDWDWRDAYNDGRWPRLEALKALKAAGMDPEPIEGD
jgi:hypothetical protein